MVSFAAFVMTYKRPLIAKETIDKLFLQTVSPHKVLIIDNDDQESGREILDLLPNYPIAYIAMGYNSGPAGAAKKGLEQLASEGYQWIAWIDDDDPPVFKDTFEKLLNIVLLNSDCGSVGVAGQFFNKKYGLISRIHNSEIDSKGFLTVDFIAGGMIKMVNAKMINEYSIFPEGKLFFGFEELDYDLQIQKAGYKLMVNKALFLQYRTYHNRLHLEKKTIKKSDRQLIRDYYSSRNMLYILKKNRLFSAFFYTFLRIIYKCVANFKFGFSHGIINLKYQYKAIYHFMIGKYGKTI